MISGYSTFKVIVDSDSDNVVADIENFKLLCDLNKPVIVDFILKYADNYTRHVSHFNVIESDGDKFMIGFVLPLDSIVSPIKIGIKEDKIAIEPLLMN